MKFYNRILGDRDYSLFEVVHFGLRLPGVLSSFGDVRSASVSNWATVNVRKAHGAGGMSERVTNKTALENFRDRGLLKLPFGVSLADLEGISFYAFYRMYDVARGCLVRKEREKFVSLTGNGWPAQAKRTHAMHADYARKT